MNLQIAREPSLIWIGLIAPTVAALSAFLWVDNPTTQGIINTAAIAVAAAITAYMVKAEDLVPIVMGAIQALVAVGVSFGLGWSPEQQALVLVPVGLIVSILVRDRVVAPAPAVTLAA